MWSRRLTSNLWLSRIRADGFTVSKKRTALSLLCEIKNIIYAARRADLRRHNQFLIATPTHPRGGWRVGLRVNQLTESYLSHSQPLSTSSGSRSSPILSNLFFTSNSLYNPLTFHMVAVSCKYSICVSSSLVCLRLFCLSTTGEIPALPEQCSPI